MLLEGKLKIFREKIDSAVVFNEGFRQLVGIELFDFIQANNAVENEFEKRLNYLKNLAENRDFKLLQDNLIRAIQKILNLTSLQEIQKKQKEWDGGKNALINKLKPRPLTKGGAPDFLTLPDLYLALQDKNNYYRLGDKSYFSLMEEEISKVTHIAPVRQQYKINVERFFQLVFFNKFNNDNEGQEQYRDLINEYNEYWYKLEEYIYRIPINMHFKNFEEFFYDCVKFYPRPGYEYYHSLFEGFAERITEKEFKKTKENALIVIEDLIEALEIEAGDKKEDKKRPKSMHLITNSLEPMNAIFLVLDEQFEIPIRFAVKNKNGNPTYIKKLYDIAYLVDVPNKIVNYNRNIADGINNGLFKKSAVAKYMKTNKLNKPTLVQKSEKNTLVLKNEIIVKMGLVKNVPLQYQSLYIDKTR